MCLVIFGLWILLGIRLDGCRVSRLMVLIIRASEFALEVSRFDGPWHPVL